jgi:hypothetical protein
MGEAFTKAVPHAVCFRVAGSGGEERREIDFHREGNINIDAWQIGGGCLRGSRRGRRLCVGGPHRRRDLLLDLRRRGGAWRRLARGFGCCPGLWRGAPWSTLRSLGLENGCPAPAEIPAQDVAKVPSRASPSPLESRAARRTAPSAGGDRALPVRPRACYPVVCTGSRAESKQSSGWFGRLKHCTEVQLEAAEPTPSHRSSYPTCLGESHAVGLADVPKCNLFNEPGWGTLQPGQTEKPRLSPQPSGTARFVKPNISTQRNKRSVDPLWGFAAWAVSRPRYSCRGRSGWPIFTCGRPRARARMPSAGLGVRQLPQSVGNGVEQRTKNPWKLRLEPLLEFGLGAPIFLRDRSRIHGTERSARSDRSMQFASPVRTTG